MNVIGIDYQQTLSVICLREGLELIRFRAISDGMRPVIPNAVRGEDVWGSRALLTSSLELLRTGDPSRQGPWLDEPGAELFWRGIARRLYSYLGYTHPTFSNGYQVMVSLQTPQFAPTARRIYAICQRASLSDVNCISADNALLSRWLGEQDAGSSIEPSVVIAVVVGDTGTTVTAYDLRRSDNQHSLRLAQKTLPSQIATGHTTWMSKMLAEVHSRLKSPPAPGYELALHDAVIEFISRLSREKAEKSLAWTGFLRERMFTSFSLSRQDCANWPEVSAFMLALREAAEATLRELGCGSKAGCILVGGIGALWPFVKDAVAPLGPVWQSATPQDDLARGATWWPNFQERLSGSGTSAVLSEPTFLPAPATRTGITADSPTYPASLHEESSEESAQPVPPWLRQNLVDF